ncbi:MAG: FAD-dependent oxidoreductase [Thiolinea sp.]
MIPEQKALNILIIGAGPTGLTAALELARYGVKTDIVDKKMEPSTLSRAVGIMPVSIELLRPFGVGDAILREGVPLQKVMFHREERRLAFLDFSDITEPGNTIIGLAQDRTETLMSEALQTFGVEVKYDHIVTVVEDCADHVKVSFANGDTGNYDWVIAADGVRSVVREQLNIPFVGYDLPEDWSIADVDIGEKYEQGLFSAWLGEDGKPTIIVPIDVQRVRVVSATSDALKSLPKAVLSNLDVSHVRRSGTFTISVRQAETYHKGRILLAGDAAHCHSPVGGRGMNLGIADAVAAAQAILNHSPDEYSCQRHLAGARVIRETERARKLIVSESPVAKLFLTVMLGMVEKLPFMKKRMLRQMTSF